MLGHTSTRCISPPWLNLGRSQDYSHAVLAVGQNEASTKTVRKMKLPIQTLLTFDTAVSRYRAPGACSYVCHSSHRLFFYNTSSGCSRTGYVWSVEPRPFLTRRDFDSGTSTVAVGVAVRVLTHSYQVHSIHSGSHAVRIGKNSEP